MCSGFGNESWPHENDLVQGVEHTDTHIDALVQDCSISGALAMGILQSCTKPSIYIKVSGNMQMWLSHGHGDRHQWNPEHNISHRLYSGDEQLYLDEFNKMDCFVFDHHQGEYLVLFNAINQIFYFTLQWRHDDRDGVPNHQPYDCLLTRLFRRRSKNTSKSRVTGFCGGNSSMTGEFPAQGSSNAENVSIWWRHHEAI